YHTFDEVAYELDSIANHFSSITLLDTIGYSTCDSLPIFAMKIYDTIGRLLKNFDTSTKEIVWQCTDKWNRKISNGIYWLVGETNEQVLIIIKVVVLN
ncbi:unnamed protein product, partial [marine sediment metagenome]